MQVGIRDVGWIPGSGRSPEAGHGNPLQYPCLENPHGKKTWRAPAHRVAKSRTRLKPLSMHSCSVDVTQKTLRLDSIKWYVWSDERRASSKAKEMGKGQPGRWLPTQKPAPPPQKKRICRRSGISQVSEALPRDERDENQDVGEEGLGGGSGPYCCFPLSSKPWSIWTTG